MKQLSIKMGKQRDQKCLIAVGMYGQLVIHGQ